MDRIFIRNLHFFGHHGVFDFEQEQGQEFIVSAVLYQDFQAAGWADDLMLSTSYADVSQFLVDYLTEHTFKLLEAAAEHVCRALLLQFPLVWKVELELQKPNAPIELQFETVGVQVTREWHRAYIALGSNMGNKEAYIRDALAGMEEDPCIRLRQVSSLIQTTPYGGVEQDDFLNGACAIDTLYHPQQLLDALHRLEQAAHRERKIVWGPRTLDLDILLFDNIIMTSDELTIPHADMANRDFVLKPMAEIAPYVRHPVYHETMKQMLDRLMG